MQAWIFVRIFVSLESISNTIGFYIYKLKKNKVKSIDLKINKGKKVS
jgi:hypothetical protein